MALTQITTDGIKDGTITGTDLTTNIDLVDNQKLRLGTGGDLEIYHNGSDSYISSLVTGALYQRARTGWYLGVNATSGGSDKAIHALQNAGVEIYYDNVKKFETTSTGATVTGDLSVTANIDLADSTGGSNNRITLGTGDDLSLYHDGSNGVLYNSGSGNLTLVGNGTNRVQIRADVNKNSITCNADGNVELYHDNSKKLETVTGGVYVYGDIVGAVGGTGNIFLGDNNKFIAGGGNDLQIYHDGSDSFIQNSTGQLILRTASVESAIVCVPNGSVNLYYDNDKKFETASLGVYSKSIMPASHETFDIGQNIGRWNNIYIADNGKLRIGQSDDLQIYHDPSSNKSIIKETGSGSFDIQGNWIQILNEAGNETKAIFKDDGAVELYYDNSKKLETTSSGATVTGTLTSTALTVNGASSPTIFNHTGGFCVRMARSGKNLDFNANYAAAGTHATIDVTAGMELRLAVAGTDRVKVDSTGNWVPATNNARDLGSSSLRWRNVYTNDLNLSNEGGANDVDGTWGSYTIQEGSEDLFLVNKRSGKKYKFNLTEVS